MAVMSFKVARGETFTGGEAVDISAGVVYYAFSDFGFIPSLLGLVMSSKGFAHLHVHTQYSLLDGAVQPEKLFARCKELGMDSVAMTDHGNIFGAIDFYTRAKRHGIKPIIGIEAYIAPDSRFEKQKSSMKEAAYHLVLLAENAVGYRNLMKLSSIGYTEGFYYRPRIDMEILAELNEGIICTSACVSGEIARAIAAGNRDHAKAAVERYLEIFGADRYFIELQEHPGTDLPDIRGELIELAREMGVGVVATNDVHFLMADDYEAHDALTCISTGKLVSDEGRMKYPECLYLKSAEEMRMLFADCPEACDNTLKIAERCNVEIDLETTHAPVFVPPDGSTDEEYLTKVCYEGARKMYGEITDEVKERLDMELGVIEGKGFSSYFLIVWEFCQWARDNRIAVGARGSAVGTIVGYCLGICNMDPIKYDLLFERFMDPERAEMPDIDIDICQDGRGRLLDYVRQRYGEIAQVITFGTMKARAVMRDVCRVMDVPLAEADRLAKLIPADLKMTLDKALDVEPELKEAYEKNPQIKNVIDVGRRLEGLTRHSSVHACAVIIADEPLSDLLPLYKTPGSDDLITQYEGPMCEQVGMLKMDFLGLKTLSVIERTEKLIKINHGVEIDMEAIDVNDQKVFNVFGRGKTKGVFQFESGGMADLLMKLGPDRLEDLIAANALYRPGPMALIPDFIARKHGAKWEVPHPIMRDVLEETFGIMVYQEQVMRICNRLGGIPLRAAYGLIKAIGKKKLKVIAKAKAQFVDGCVEKGVEENEAQEIFDLIEKFAGYGFNKSHATRYSFIAYQTAYLKAYYPVEFMAALLTYEMGNTDKVVDYIGECKGMGIEVLAPDINESSCDFTVIYREDADGVKGGFIRFGLGAVKGVGGKAVEQVIGARGESDFKSLYDFCERVDLRAANKQVTEALIKAGAFDQLGGSRRQMMAGLERAMQAGAARQADIRSGQMNLFGGGGESEEVGVLPDVAPWPEMEMLKYEKEVLGFYVTMNPLSRHAEMINAYSSANTSKLKKLKEGTEVVMGGMIKKVRNIITKNGRNAGAKMAVIMVEDVQGEFEVVLFPKVLEKFSEMIAEDEVVFVQGKVDCKREMPNVLCDEVIKLEDVCDKLATRVWIELGDDEVSDERVSRIGEVCAGHRGKSSVCVSCLLDGKWRVDTVAASGFNVRADMDFRKKLEAVVGEGRVKYSN